MIEITTLSELTIDGKLALHRTSSSKELFDYSTDELKAWFHGQRALSDAIMVGANTVRVDDPQLTVRHVAGPNPLRVIPSSDGLLPLNSALLTDGLPTLVATARKAQPATLAALEARPGVETVTCGDDEVDLVGLMEILAARGLRSLIVEGGSTLLSSLFGRGLVSKIIIKHIPIISGDPEAPTYLTLTPRPDLDLGVTRWRMDDWFVKGGIGVSVYAREAGVNALSHDPLAELAALLAEGTGAAPPAAFDARIDVVGADDSLARYVKHQALLRAYQARYVLLPVEAPAGGVLEPLQRYYGETRLRALAELRPRLEAELIAPLAPTVSGDIAAYVEVMLAEIRGAPENPFTAFLAGAEHRDDHYRNFLVQSSPDLLAEASASALGVIGEYGEPQSALFRILIDEFGYGAHGKKHAVLYRATMASFGLDDAYNGYWPWFDTAALELHNVIHWLFQNPRNVFRQVGFLLHAETAYQRSTLAHHRYLRQFHPKADARYFGEHAHIDLHHTRMVIDEAVTPLVARFGPEAGGEIIAGAEMTKAAFARAGEHLLGVSEAFAAAPSSRYGAAGPPREGLGRPVTPASDLPAAPVQVGVLGVLQDGRDFAAFPPAAIGRLAA